MKRYAYIGSAAAMLLVGVVGYLLYSNVSVNVARINAVDYESNDARAPARQPSPAERGKEPPDIDAQVAAASDFIPIDTSVANELVSQILKKNAELVRAEQANELYTLIEKLLLAYKTGSANDILDTVLRTDYRIRDDAVKWHAETLKRYLKSGEKLPNDPSQLVRMVVDRNYGGSGGSGYKNLFNGLSVTTSSIEFGEKSKLPTSLYDQDVALFSKKLNSLPNGIVAMMPTIDYERSAMSVLKANGKLLFANVYLAATDADGNKYSRRFRYYWSPKDSTWLPMEVVCLYGNSRKADPFF